MLYHTIDAELRAVEPSMRANEATDNPIKPSKTVNSN